MKGRVFNILLTWLFLSYKVNGQTCIIALRAKDAVVVAADSRRTTFTNVINSTGARSTVLTYETVCKIEHAGSIYFSQAGLDSEEAYKTARGCAIDYKTISTVADCFLIRRKPQVHKYLETQALNKEFFMTSFEYLKHFETIFYCIENHVPIVINIEFEVISKINEKIAIRSINRIFKPRKESEIDAVTLGEHTVADSLLKTDIFTKMGAQEAIYYILQRQSEAKPEHVAAPFEMVTLFINNTVRWDLDPLNCK